MLQHQEKDPWLTNKKSPLRQLEYQMRQRTYRTWQLNNIRALANEMIRYDPSPQKSGIFSIIKMFADKMTLDAATKLASETYNPAYPRADSYFLKENETLTSQQSILQAYRNCLLGSYTKSEIEIVLGIDPVVVFPWKADSLVHTLATIGAPENPWEEDHHRIRLFLPVGVSFCTNGLHSTFAGIIKKDGKITVKPKAGHGISDLSPLYRLMEFDGTNYVKRGSELVIGKAMSFEFGCIFEIGRLLYEHNICFKDIRYDSSLEKCE